VRINRDILLNLAREHAARLAATDRSLVCIYLTGSLLRDEPLLGGLTDIDLICVHDTPPAAPRQVVRITEEVHLDIAHLYQGMFDHPRRLRTDAWIGGGICSDPLVLFEAAHWFDFTRANIAAQYFQTENVSARARFFASRARQTWLSLSDETIPQGPGRQEAYLGATSDCANALSCLSGMPLPLRRMGVDLPSRLGEIGRSDLLGALVAQFYNESATHEAFDNWLPAWKTSLEALRTIAGSPVSLGRYRGAYYEKAILALVDERPAAALWILLRTWTLAAQSLPHTGEPYKAWKSLIKDLELDSKHFEERVNALDAVVDRVDEAVEQWQVRNQ
jgi:hypothetical protein